MQEEPHTPHPIDEKDFYTVMSHFYRGEVGRIMLWRQRLDLTTNWAIAATSAVLTYCLSHDEATHLIFAFANIIGLFLLMIEARRYRYYDAFRARVRMLEAHFLRPVVQMRTPGDAQNWREQLAEDLALPSFKISRNEAVFRRFGRNYVWLFLIIFGAWFVKIWGFCQNASSFGAALQMIAARQPLPPALYGLLVLAFSGLMLWLVVGAIRVNVYSAETDIAGVRERDWQV